MMLRLLKNKKAQSTAEYTILIALVVAAIVGMQTYVKRGLQARMKVAGDDYVTTLSSDPNWGSVTAKSATLEKQYEDTRISSKSTQELSETKDETMASGGTITRATSQSTKAGARDYRTVE